MHAKIKNYIVRDEYVIFFYNFGASFTKNKQFLSKSVILIYLLMLNKTLMKRILFSTVLLFFVAIASAQFNFGIKAGYNSTLTLSNLGSVSDGSYNLDNVQGEMWNNFQAGLFARVFIKKFYIQPELLYSMQKKEYTMTDLVIDKVNDTKIDVNTFMNVSNVEIPILFGYKLLDMKVANLRVFAGPKFILNAGSSLDYKNLTEEQVNGSDLLADFKKSQVDLEVGAGIDVFMFALDARLNLVQDAVGKISSIGDVAKIQPPTSAFVISLSWKIF